MNRRVSIALVTAAATALTMAAPAAAQTTPPTTEDSSAALLSDSSTADGTDAEPAEQGSAEGLSSSDEGTDEDNGAETDASSSFLGSSGSSSDATDAPESEEPTTTPDPDAPYLCPDGTIPAGLPGEATEEEEDSFLGPFALFEEITGSSIPGQSASTDTEDGVDENGCTEAQQINPDDYPEWMHSSLFPSDDVKMAMTVIQAVMAVGMAMTQAATIAIQFVPGAREALRDALISIGINPDA